MDGAKTILIIDDEPDLCNLLTMYFRRKNFDVYYSHSLSEGERLLQSVKPDILLLDNNLPDGMGWSKAELFNKEYAPLKVILMSGNPTVFPSLEDHYKILIKPISFADLDYLV